MNWFVRISMSIVVVLMAVAVTDAQRPPNGPNAQAFEQEGRVMGVIPGGIQLLTERNVPWLVQVDPRRTAVKVTGTAEPGFLQPGIFVKFTGTIDEKGALSEELKELEIYTPAGKGGMGTFPSGAGENAKPVPKLTAGTYDFRGKVVVYRDGEITVVAGKKITGRVASDAKVAVNVADLRFAQLDDAVKVRGWERTPSRGPQQPGTAIGTEVEIALSKPLAAMPKKGAGRPARPGKNNPPEDPAVSVDDPFNLGGNKKPDEKMPDEKKPDEKKPDEK
jgi:hypothetical protein